MRSKAEVERHHDMARAGNLWRCHGQQLATAAKLKVAEIVIPAMFDSVARLALFQSRSALHMSRHGGTRSTRQVTVDNSREPAAGAPVGVAGNPAKRNRREPFQTRGRCYADLFRPERPITSLNSDHVAFLPTFRLAAPR
jgi:hypothetical protein